MSTVSLPINDEASTVTLFRNEDGSGWMVDEAWGWWKGNMDSDDHDKRERARNRKDALQAFAAALITQSPPEKATEISDNIQREANRGRKAKSVRGHMMDQWVRHLPVQHYIGTIALNFIPVFGTFLSGAAAAMTPMVIAASKKAIANGEGRRTGTKFRQEYYNALDAYMKDPGGSPLPMDFMAYQAEVVAPAVQKVRDDIKGGTVETAEGSFPLDASGFAMWEEAHRALPELEEDFSGPFGFVEKGYYAILHDIESRPKTVAVAVVAGALAGVAAHAALKED